MRYLGTFLGAMAIASVSFSAFAEEQCDPENGIRLTGTDDAPWRVQVLLKPKDIPLNAPFDAVVILCSQPEMLPSQVTVDATMPAHKHGMNYDPEVTRVDGHRYEVKNLVFHMPGTWRLEVTAYEGDKPHRFTHEVPIQ
ncbi:MAG: hypothetical protein AAGF54_04915 [Pseudomonadota bacterium]